VHARSSKCQKPDSGKITYRTRAPSHCYIGLSMHIIYMFTHILLFSSNERIRISPQCPPRTSPTADQGAKGLAHIEIAGRYHRPKVYLSIMRYWGHTSQLRARPIVAQPVAGRYNVRAQHACCAPHFTRSISEGQDHHNHFLQASRLMKTSICNIRGI
jgi:hypothetical protein